MISLRLLPPTEEFLAKLRSRGPQIITVLTQKMNQLMILLQSKVVGESIPSFFPNGAPNIAASVMFNPATLSGTKITGSVQAGGPKTTKVTLKSGRAVDYAAVQEYGVGHSYQILPFNKKALAFLFDGKQVIVKSVQHPGLMPRPFMRGELQNMEEYIVAELRRAAVEALNS